jgi:hypothetical protein
VLVVGDVERADDRRLKAEGGWGRGFASEGAEGWGSVCKRQCHQQLDISFLAEAANSGCADLGGCTDLHAAQRRAST